MIREQKISLNVKQRSGQISEYKHQLWPEQRLQTAFFDRILHRVTVELDANIRAGHEQIFLNVNSMMLVNCPRSRRCSGL